jgi:hypothetical protein
MKINTKSHMKKRWTGTCLMKSLIERKREEVGHVNDHSYIMVHAIQEEVSTYTGVWDEQSISLHFEGHAFSSYYLLYGRRS